jgi:decaprenylphospho-beta-D-erythro-pentofuranosid-2-ulose 2-reductase
MFAVNTAWPAAVLAACRGTLVAQGSGQVLVLSSVAAVRTRRANYTYGAGKMGLDGFALGYAESLRGTGVDVKILRPGFVTTKMTAHLSPVPFSTDAQAVAARAVAALRGRATVVWSPKVLQVVFTALAHLPAALWRKMPG